VMQATERLEIVCRDRDGREGGATVRKRKRGKGGEDSGSLTAVVQDTATIEPTRMLIM
jgi:hypothetical protein